MFGFKLKFLFWKMLYLDSIVYMRIIDKNNSIQEICDLIVQKARYQKVVLCVDENSDTQLIDDIVNGLGKEVVRLTYYYNKRNISQFFDMINNGVRVVIYNVALEHFYKLQNDNNYILNIFIPQSSFLLPYMSNVESVYGDNLLVCDTNIKDYTSIMFLYQLSLDKVWNLLIQEVEVDTSIFKNIDAVVNAKVDFCGGLLNVFNYVKSSLTNEYREIDEGQLPFYVYLRLCHTLKMLESVNSGEVEYVDFYKTETSSKSIEKAHDLLIKYNMVEVLNKYSGNLIKINCNVLNRIKILIKKYFNFKNIKINKLNKIIKYQSKDLNTDNLLYIAYILNAI